MTSAAPATAQQLRVLLPFSSEREFAERYAPFVTRGGILLATSAVRPIGTRLRFEFLLSGNVRLLIGEGVVARVLNGPNGAPRSMAVRFLRLDAASKAVIERTVHHRLVGPDSPTEHGHGPGLSAAPLARSLTGEMAAIAPVAAAAMPFAPGQSGPDASDSIQTVGSGLFAVPPTFAQRRPTEREVPPPSAVETAVGPNPVPSAPASGRPGPGPVSAPSSARLAPIRPRLPSPSLGLGICIDDIGWRVLVARDDGIDVAPELTERPTLVALVRAIDAKLSQLPARVVFALPPDVSQRSRRALHDESRRLGFVECALVNATSAVALAYAFGRAFTRKRLLVLHLPTQSVALVHLQGTDIAPVAHTSARLTAYPSEPSASVWLDCVQSFLRAQRTAPTELDGIVVSGDDGPIQSIAETFAGSALGPLTLERQPSVAAEHGAALYAQALSRAAAGKRAASLSEVTAFPLWLAREGDSTSVVALEASARLPAERHFHYHVEAHQPVRFAILEMRTGHPDALFTVESVTAGNVTLSVSAGNDGLVACRATLPTGRQVQLGLDPLDELPPGFLVAPKETPAGQEPEAGGVLRRFGRLLRRR